MTTERTAEEVAHNDISALGKAYADALVRAEAAESRLAAMQAALEAYEAAIDEAEAIFGGEYADHYGPMFEKALKARDARRAALSQKDGEKETRLDPATIEACAKVAEGARPHAFDFEIAAAIRSLSQQQTPDHKPEPSFMEPGQVSSMLARRAKGDWD